MYEPQNIPMLHTNPAAVAAAETAKAEIQASFIMAKQFPRNTDQARADIIKLCKKNDFAEAVEYSKPVGGSKITGLSIRFAEQALRLWKNVRTRQRTVYEDDEIRRILVTVIDLEENAEFSREISIAKTVERKNSKGREVVSERPNSYGETVYIVKATDDELANKEAAAVSKVIRNEGLRLLPYDIKEEALRVARETVKGQHKDPDELRRKIVDSFGAIGVKVRDLEMYLKHSLDQCSPAELEDLRLMHQAIKHGEAKWADYIVIEEPSQAATLNDELKAQTEKK